MQTKYRTPDYIFDLPTGTHIEGFCGQIVKVRKRFDNRGQGKDWSLQDLIVAHENGQELTVTLDNREEVHTSAAGETIFITATNGQRGLAGLIAEDKEERSTGQWFRRLRVTHAANVEFSRGQGRSQGNQSQGRQNAQQRPQNQGQGYSQGQNRSQGQERPQNASNGQGQGHGGRQSTQSHGQAQKKPTEDPVAYCKTLAAKIVAVRCIAYDATVARASMVKAVHGHSTSPEGIGAESAGLWIELMKRMPHDVLEAMPTNLYKKHPFQGKPMSELYAAVTKSSLPKDMTQEELTAANAAAQAAVMNLRNKQSEPEPQSQPQGHQPQNEPEDYSATDLDEKDDIPF